MNEIVKENERYPHLCSEHFFKFLMMECCKDNADLLKSIIFEVTGIRPVELTPINTEMSPSNAKGKVNRLDFHTVDDNGHHHDIEMETSRLNENSGVRFQVYYCKLLSSQEVTGKPYRYINPVYQIIFINYRDGDRLVGHFTSRDDEGRFIYYDRIHTYFIYMDYVNELLKLKPLEEFTDFEKIVYIFKNSLTRDIINLKTKEVDYVMKKYEQFRETDWYEEADSLTVALDDLEAIYEESMATKNAELSAMKEERNQLKDELETKEEENKLLKDELEMLKKALRESKKSSSSND